jgi:hypothetical protein
MRCASRTREYGCRHDIKRDFAWKRKSRMQYLVQLAKLKNQATGYVYVDRERCLKGNRLETQGILTGGEAGLVLNDKTTLFLLRTKGEGGARSVWWPQIRFPAGQYAFAFAVEPGARSWGAKIGTNLAPTYHLGMPGVGR